MTDQSVDTPASEAPKKGPGLLALLPLAFVLALFGLFAAMMLSDRNPKEIRSVLIGQPAPLLKGDFLLPPAATIDPSKPTVVNFFASWCTPCRAEHDSLIALSKTGAVNLIGVAFQDDPNDAARFLNQLGNPFLQAITDPGARLAVGFGVAGVPETYVIDKDGTLRYRHWGPVVGDSLEATLLPEIAKWQ